MTSDTRLKVSALMIVISALFGVIVAQSPSIAHDVMNGYVAMLLTLFVLVNVWKKP